MKIFPAIDIKDGKAVRLTQGDYNKVTVFSDNPAEIALDFQAKGADFLHIVDLDGAKDGELVNLTAIKKILETGIKCQIGGGIRTLERAEKYLSLGAQRIILGSAALDDNFLQRAISQLGERLAVSVDAKGGLVATNGWLEVSAVDSLEFCEHLSLSGVSTIIYTDISCDGAMQGTNIEIFKSLKAKISSNIIASGGISSLDEIKQLSEIELYGAILGKSLYLKAIDLSQAISAAIMSK